MKSFLLVGSFFLLSTVTCQTFTKISTNTFQNALGSWKGTLTYLDYTSGKPYTMPANLMVSSNPTLNTDIILTFIYPDEPKANSKDTLHIHSNGTKINNANVFSNSVLKDGSVQIITDELGEDGNDHRKATMRHTYTFNKNKFISRKDVKFNGTVKWINRHEYSFSK